MMMKFFRSRSELKNLQKIKFDVVFCTISLGWRQKRFINTLTFNNIVFIANEEKPCINSNNLLVTDQDSIKQHEHVHYFSYVALLNDIDDITVFYPRYTPFGFKNSMFIFFFRNDPFFQAESLKKKLSVAKNEFSQQKNGLERELESLKDVNENLREKNVQFCRKLNELTLESNKKSGRKNLLEKDKREIRTLHHFACSGGTVISKALAAQPNTYLLSEVHPTVDLHIDKKQPKYLPSDISTLVRYANFIKCRELCEKIFVSSIFQVYEHSLNNFSEVILRDHSHADYCLGEKVKHKTVQSLLSPYFDFLDIVTIRNPIDSYRSLGVNGWVHLSPNNFDEYCRRLLIFLDDYKGAKLIRYEDFVLDPDNAVMEMCEHYKLGYNEAYSKELSDYTVTGDSGRSSGIIQMRERREITDEYQAEIKNSTYYKKFIDLYQLYEYLK